MEPNRQEKKKLYGKSRLWNSLIGAQTTIYVWRIHPRKRYTSEDRCWHHTGTQPERGINLSPFHYDPVG